MAWTECGHDSWYTLIVVTYIFKARCFIEFEGKFHPFDSNIRIWDKSTNTLSSQYKINFFGGNNNGELNPGEFVFLNISLENTSDNYLTNITGYIESDVIYVEDFISSFVAPLCLNLI